MPTPYADVVANGQGVSIFVRLLIRWKGSLYKLLWIDLIIYIVAFYGLHLLYGYGLDDNKKKNFEEIVQYCEKMKTTIPLSFLLGFFVAGVVGRWWQMYMGIPWLNRVTFLSDGIIIGQSPAESKKIKTILMRYLILSWILLMRKISKQIEERFKCLGVKKGKEISVRHMLSNFNKDKKIQRTFRKVITDSEIKAFESIAEQNVARTDIKYVPEYWIPLQWASRLLQKALMHGYIVDIRTTVKLIDELDRLRGQMQNLRLLCSIMIPLVYTQVVIIAVYSYFLCQLFASQFPVEEKYLNQNNSSQNRIRIGKNIDLFFYPLFTIFQFLFIMGWLKVAICLLNPFGNGEEDFQTSEILDQNLDVCWRSGCSHDDDYPDLLSPPLFNFKVTAPSNDTLNAFISQSEKDIEKSEDLSSEENAQPFVWGTSNLNPVKKLCCYKKEEEEDSIWGDKVDSSRLPDIPEDLIVSYANQEFIDKFKIKKEKLSMVAEESPLSSLPILSYMEDKSEVKKKYSNSFRF